MQNRRILGIAVFVIAAVVFLVFWLLRGQLLIGAFLGMLFLLLGIILYRRGK